MSQLAQNIHDALSSEGYLNRYIEIPAIVAIIQEQITKDRKPTTSSKTPKESPKEAGSAAPAVIYEAQYNDGCEGYASYGLYATRAQAEAKIAQVSTQEKPEFLSVTERKVEGATPPSIAPQPTNEAGGAWNKPAFFNKCTNLTCDCRDIEKEEKCNVGGHIRQCKLHWMHRGKCEWPQPKVAGEAETGADSELFYSALYRAALRGWKRGRRNQDPEAKTIASLIRAEIKIEVKRAQGDTPTAPGAGQK